MSQLCACAGRPPKVGLCARALLLLTLVLISGRSARGSVLGVMCDAVVDAIPTGHDKDDGKPWCGDGGGEKKYETDGGWGRRDSETDEDYFKRIFYKYDWEDDKEYVERIGNIQKSYPYLGIWYDAKSMHINGNYYDCLWGKNKDECDNHYYPRIFDQKDYESKEQQAKKILYIHQLMPELDCWKDYDNKYTKYYHELMYRRELGETQDDYLQRLFVPDEKDSNEAYLKKMYIIFRTYPDLVKYFFGCKYLEYAKIYLSELYRKKQDESYEEHYNRMIGNMANCWCERFKPSYPDFFPTYDEDNVYKTCVAVY